MQKLLASFAGRESAKNNDNRSSNISEIDNYLTHNKNAFQSTGDLTLSGMARGFESYAEEGGGNKNVNMNVSASTPSAFMEALMFSDSQRTRSGGGVSSLSSASSFTADSGVSSRGSRRNKNNSNNNNNDRQKFLSPLAHTAKELKKKKKNVSKLARGTVAEGMKIDPLDTFEDIKNNNKRRPSAYGRSVDDRPALWPPLEESYDDSFW